MILIDNQKFACSACINGHRSSSCQHTERPLFEIKKKGRPVTQCTQCRELRKTRSYHSKCTCDQPAATSDTSSKDGSGPSTEETPGAKRKKPSRTAPSIPTLPNGIKDILDVREAGDLKQKEQSRKRFKAMLNPCKCGCDDTKRCRCGGSELLGTIQEHGEDGVCCFTSDSAQPQNRATPSRRLLPKPKKSIAISPTSSIQVYSPPVSLPSSNSCCAPKIPQSESQPPYRDAPIVIKPLSLPPGSAGPSLLPSITTWSTPASVPSLHQHSTTSMDGCGCGENCACAGCAEHRGAVAAAAAIAAGHHSCPDRCGTCQDVSSMGMQMTSLAGPSVADDNSIESLLARAIAKLPPPPPGKLSVFQSESGGERVALVVLPRADKPEATTSPRSCCASRVAPIPPTRSGGKPPAPLTEPQGSTWVKETARYRRQIRSTSTSPSDDGLTDADAEGELDPDNEPEAPGTPASTSTSTKSWTFAQLDVDVELELGLAADAIDKPKQ